MAQNNITRMPKQSKFNIGLIVLIVIFIYVLVFVISYLSKEQVQGYEVRTGSLVTPSSFEAVILRDEEVVTSTAAGYVNYFVAEGERVAVNNLVYTLDETGVLAQYTQGQGVTESVLSEAEVDDLLYTIDEYILDFDVENFSTVYSLKHQLESKVDKITNTNLLESIEEIPTLDGQLQYGLAMLTGVTAHWIDGLEDLEVGQVNSQTFERVDYTQEELIGNSLVTEGDPIYKVYQQEDWSIAFVCEDEALAQSLVDKEYVEVTFFKNNMTLIGSVSLHNNAVGEETESIIEISFSTGSVNFSTDRFVSISVEVEQEEGLKIPVTSVVELDFFLVPESYVIFAEAENKYYINIETYMENGELSIRKIEVQPYNLLEGFYYLQHELLVSGSRLLAVGSEELYVVSEKASLLGVYNMNKGYADFKQITILDESEDYAIVQSNTAYGLVEYDYIVLNSSAISENDFTN